MTAKRVRIVGPPGTGKSTTLARHVALAAEKYEGRVIVSSFTRAAAREIASKVAEHQTLPEGAVGTLHGHALRALGKPVIAETKAAEWNEHVRQNPGLTIKGTTRSVDDAPVPVESVGKGEDSGQRLLERCAIYRARMIPREFWPDPAASDFDRRWTAWKREAGYLDFTDLLASALEHVDCAPGDPEVFFGDEAQDWSALEWALVRKWGDAAPRGCMVVGDPAQTIFSFKGADPSEFLNFEVAPENLFVLENSHRVPEAVHREAVRFLARCRLDVRTPYRPCALPGKVRRLESSELHWRSPGQLVSECASSGREEMILASCDFMLARTIQGLREAGVPFHNPYRSDHAVWNPMRGGAERLVEFLRPLRPEVFDDRADPGEVRRWTWSELARWTENVSAEGVLVRGIKVEIAARARDEKKVAKARREPIAQTDVARIFTPAARASLSPALRGPQPWRWIRDHLLPSKRALFEYAMEVCERRGPRALKGAEASRVWLFPELSPSAARGQSESDEAHDSTIRQFYVGMTRAKEELVLAGPQSVRSVEW
jgi:hypothetical protein